MVLDFVLSAADLKKGSGSLCCAFRQYALLSHCYSRWTSSLSREARVGMLLVTS